MTYQELVNLINTNLTRVGTNRVSAPEIKQVCQELLDFTAAIDNKDAIPTWTSTLTFQLDGTGAGKYCKHPDINSKLRIFETKIANNTGNEPPTDPNVTETTNWKEISASAGSGIKEWAPGLYGAGLVIVYHNHSILGRGLCILVEPTRPFSSTNIETEITAGSWAFVAISKEYVDALGTAVTASGTNTYTATMNPAITEYTSGRRYFVRFTNGNTGAATLNLNSLGAKSIKKNAATDLGSGDIQPNQALCLVYDGTNFQVIGFYGLNITQAEIAAIPAGETNLFTVTKSVDGTMVTYGAGVKQIDNFASNLNTLLADSAAWTGDTITLSGNNLTGGLGQTAQEFVISNNLGTIYKCVSHVLGTTSANGSATWIRTRSRDNITDAAVISALTTESGWDAVNNTKTISTRSVLGSWYTSTSGYTYFCYDEVPGTSWAWRRIGQPNAVFVQITDATLKSEIEAHAFATTPMLAPTSATKGEDRQEHFWENPAGTPHLAKCIDVSGVKKWIKIK